MDIHKSIFGKLFGLAHDNAGVFDGPNVLVNNGGATGLVRLPGGASAPIAGGSTLTLTQPLHSGKIINLDTAAGTTITLPTPTGSGAIYTFIVSVLATTNNHIIKVPSAAETMIGGIDGSRIDSGNAVLGFAAQTTSDTITLNRTTTGSVSLGEWIEVRDYSSTVFWVRGWLTATGAAFATPFSAAVS